MTVYVTDGEGCDRFLWADTDDEAILAASAIGVAEIIPGFKEWWAYRLTLDQWADAIIAGATVTDRWEPAVQHARRTGRLHLIDVIAAHRLRRTAA